MECLPELIPAQFQSDAKAAAAAVKGLDHVLIAGHVRPDGDAIGAMAACGFILAELGRSFAIYSPNGKPAYLSFMKMPGPVYSSLESLPFEPAAAIYVDCSDSGRLGKALAERCQDWPSVNIDHHLCKSGLGNLANFVNPAAAATCQLMAYLADALDIPLTGGLAEAIGLGVLTDTGNFAHDNTSAAVFSLCAQLETNGCHLPDIREELSSNWTINRLKLWGELFMHTHQVSHKRVAWSVIMADDIRRYDCEPEDLEGYIDALRRLRDVEIALTVRQEENDTSKFSLRSRKSVNVQQIAAELGGGGHKNAAGGSRPEPPWQALWKILAVIDNHLKV